MKVLAAILFGAVMATETGVNPIRKVVTLMQEMQAEVEAEGEKEAELFKKFMCYCKGNNESLKKQAAEQAAANDALTAKVEGETAEKKQTDADLAQAKSDRTDAKKDLAKATKIREKENATFMETNADAVANRDACSSAISSLEKATGASFLQSSQAVTLKKVIGGYADSLDNDDKESLAAFLQGDYSTQSGQIIGILKNMLDEMEKDLGEAGKAEKAAQAGFEELKAAKLKEIQATTDQIEALTKRSGELAVSIVQNKNAAEDAAEESADATNFLNNLKKTCADKQSEWDERQATRAQEIEAINEAIKVLNDDDALDLFKGQLKSPPKPVVVEEQAFLQVKTTKGSKMQKVVAMVKSMKFSNPQLSLLASQIKSGKVDFSKVLKMIDDMVTLLGDEQSSDEKTRDWCNTEFDSSDDSQKDLTAKAKSLASSISQLKDEIANLKQAISETQDAVASLDKSVAEATEQRKAENAEFSKLLQANMAAMKLLELAKHKMNKFYNPDMYKKTEDVAAAKRMVAEDAAENAFIQLSMKAGQPGPAPETFEGAYSGKSQGSNKIFALLDKLIDELKTGNQAAEHEEKTATRDYEQNLADAAKSRAENVKSIVDKKASLADLETSLEDTKAKHVLTSEELANVTNYITDLHGKCDFIVANFEARREARTNEVEGLKKAKAVLSGADYGFF
jgi:septal ring factor EnvC (AmiA/AmiB activator)